MSLVFDLVKSLSAKEKEYISKQFNKNKAYKKSDLFQAIALQDVYDLDAIQRKTKENKATIYYRASKVREDMLRFLREYYREHNTAFKLREMLDYVSILYQKSLYRYCLRELDKIRALANRYEYHNILQETNYWEIRIIYAKMDMRFLRKRIEALETSTEQLAHITHNKGQYWLLFLEMLSFIREKTNSSEKGLDKLYQFLKNRNIALLSDEKLALSFEAKILHLFGNILKHQIGGDTQAAKDLAADMVKKLEENKHLYQEDSSLYISSLSSLIVTQLMLEDFDGIDNYLESLKQAPRTRRDSEQGILTRYYQAKLVFLMQNEQFQEALQVAVEAIDKQKTLQLDILPGTFEYYAAMLSIYIEQYSRAISYLEIFVNINKAKNRVDIQCVAKLLYLLCQYEVGNRAYVVNIIPNVKGFLRKNNFLDFESNALLNYLKNVDSFISLKEEEQALVKLKEHILAYRTLNKKLGLLGFFDLLYWLGQKLTTPVKS